MSKESNPKDAIGVGKWRTFTTIPMTVMCEVGAAFTEGAHKYGRHNYRYAGATASIYIDGAIGHIMQWWEGEDNDPVTTLSHLSKAIANLVIIRDSMIQGTLKDDRPPKANLDPFRDELQASVDHIVKKWPDPVEPHTEINRASDLKTEVQIKAAEVQIKAAKLNQIILSSDSSKSLMDAIAKMECEGEKGIVREMRPAKLGDFQTMKRYPCRGFEPLKATETAAQVSPEETFDPAAERRKVFERALERATEALDKFALSVKDL